VRRSVELTIVSYRVNCVRRTLGKQRRYFIYNFISPT